MSKKLILIILLILNSKFIAIENKKPRVSIITSLYKGEKFIRGFLEDITQQTIFTKCELWLIRSLIRLIYTCKLIFI